METVQRRELQYQPDCIGVSVSGELYVSFYELEDAGEQRKGGGLMVIGVDGGEKECKVDAGVLDFKVKEGERLVSCCSDGSLRVHNSNSLQQTAKLAVFPASTTYLSVLNDTVSVTSSSGHLAICDLASLSLLRCVQITPYESWFTQVTPSGIYASAGTEIVFLPSGSEDILRIETGHQAEICSFEVDAWTLRTGDYSGEFRTMDLRTRASIASVKLCTSGIWRFAQCGEWLAAACMQSGLLLHSSTQSIWDNTQSLVYGLLVHPPYLYSCSFYDRLLCKFLLPNA